MFDFNGSFCYTCYMVNNEDLKKITDDIKNLIIKQHMKTYYHWTVGILCFTIGMLLGILVS